MPDREHVHFIYAYLWHASDSNDYYSWIKRCYTIGFSEKTCMLYWTPCTYFKMIHLLSGILQTFGDSSHRTWWRVQPKHNSFQWIFCETFALTHVIRLTVNELPVCRVCECSWAVWCCTCVRGEVIRGWPLLMETKEEERTVLAARTASHVATAHHICEYGEWGKVIHAYLKPAATLNAWLNSGI